MTTTSFGWQDLLADARTGDLMLFASSDAEGKEIGLLTGGKYSHVGMIIRTDPTTPPWLWHESGIAIGEDPVEHTTHTGAQLNEMTTALPVILKYHDHPYYRRLQFDRSPEFEASIREVVDTCEGVPFPSILHMAERWFEGHFLHMAAPATQMFCSQLVALTFQKVGLLGTENPPNWYSPVSFSASSAQAVMLKGASFVPEVPFDISTLPPTPSAG